MTHDYDPCEHTGRHGYTLPGEPEYEFCERCRQPEYARAHTHAVTVEGPSMNTAAWVRRSFPLA